MPIRKWNQAAVIANAMRVTDVRMARVSGLLMREVQRSISRPNPGGRNPSAPGEPPKRVSSRLYRSIVAEVRRHMLRVSWIIGSDAPHARRLELGFVGRDSLGRYYDQAPRPFLRPALLRSRERILAIMRGRA